MNIKLNVYNEDWSAVTKTLSATTTKIGFGTIRKLMKLLKIEQAASYTDIFNILGDVWDDVINLLGRIFPEATEEDWEHVSIDELLPTIIAITKYSLTHANKIPTEKN